jgi:hypothetical protein
MLLQIRQGDSNLTLPQPTKGGDPVSICHEKWSHNAVAGVAVEVESAAI